MLKNLDLSTVVCLDIETVPGHASFAELDAVMQENWAKKAERMKIPDSSADELYFDKAGIFAEYGKIICITVGIFANSGTKIRLKSFAGDDEKALLQDFFSTMSKVLNSPTYKICGHNIKEFDIPWICRRAVIHGLELPRSLDVGGKKPWEVPYMDTMELWKFGDRKSFVSLKLLTHLLGIPSPKDDIDGSEVAGVYWLEEDLPRIVRYCEKDVAAVCQLLLRLQNKELLPDEQIVIV